MKPFFLLLFSFLITKVYAQAVLDSHRVAKFSYAFSISPEGQSEGDGADSLLSIAHQHQLFLLGEYHGGVQIPQLTSFLIRQLAPMGYKHHAAEIGPAAQSALRQVIQAPDPAEALQQINDRYYHRVQESEPIPFFMGKQDALILQALADEQIAFYGLDQEYVNGLPLWLNELKSLPCWLEFGPPISWNAMDSLIDKAYKRDETDSRFNMFAYLLEHDTVRQFKEQVYAQGCAQAMALFDAWEESMKIYGSNYQRGGYSHAKRVSYIRRKFEEVLKNITPNEKLLVRIGALHTARSHRLGAYDIGNLAQTRNLSSVSFTTTNRYYQTEDALIDRWKDRQDRQTQFAFYQMGRKDQWVLINLRRLRTAWQKDDFQLANDYNDHLLRQIIEDYDYLLVSPTDQDQTILLHSGISE